MRATLIACPNGFGHFRRAKLLALELVARKIEVSICTNRLSGIAMSHSINGKKNKHLHHQELRVAARCPGLQKSYKTTDGRRISVRLQWRICNQRQLSRALLHTDFGLIFAIFWHRELGLTIRIGLNWNECD